MLPGVVAGIAGKGAASAAPGGGTVYATFDGTTSSVTLSGGNLTVTHSNTTSNSGAKTTALKSAGKCYFEATMTDLEGSGDCVGILTSAGTLANLVTNGTNCAAAYRVDGNIFSNDAFSLFNIGPIADGNRVDVAVDLDNEKVWFRRDGRDWNSPGTGGFTALMTTASATTTLSNNSLTTTNGFARSPHLKNSGKFYFEATAGDWNSTGDGIGVLTAAGAAANITITGANFGGVYRSGAVWGNNASSGKSVGAVADGDRLDFSIDLDNDKIWVRRNGGNWNGLAIGSENPATNTGGVSISSFSATTMAPASAIVGTGNVTFNFGNTSFVGTPPSGFTSGWTNNGADPATNTGGVSISSYSATTMTPAVGFGGTGTQSGDNVTLNFGASGFSGSVPSGFTSGWPV